MLLFSTMVGARATIALVSGLVAPVSIAGAAPQVSVPGLGDLIGVAADGDVAMFRGLPYGQAPIGDLRWRAPRPFGSWEGVLDATSFGSPCSGHDHGADGSEDCLFLNVAGPASGVGVTTAKLPVMAWIHGGTYDTGESNDFANEKLVAAAPTSTIVVTLNYRINTFGFLGSRELAARGEDGTTGNYGLQDQRLALVWIRDHISAFGGDNRAVTIFGESSGANSVLHHLIQPASFGLYSKAIIESGGYEGGVSADGAQAIFDRILAHAGCDADLDCFLQLNKTAIQAAKDEMVAVSGSLPVLHWGPVIDGVSMTASPQELIARGEYNNQVPIVIGSNRDEWSIFTLANTSFYPSRMTEDELDALLVYVGDDREAVKQLYDPSVYEYPSNLGAFSQSWWTAVRIGTDNGIPFEGFPVGAALGYCGARRIAGHMVHGGSPKVFMYNFAKPLPAFAAFHGIEIPYVFQDVPDAIPGDEPLERAMASYWTTFARTGEPSIENDTLPEWPAYDPVSDKILQLDSGFRGLKTKERQFFRKNACDFWDARAAGISREVSV